MAICFSRSTSWSMLLLSSMMVVLSICASLVVAQNCGAQKSCSSCLDSASCVWCSKSNECLDGGFFGPDSWFACWNYYWILCICMLRFIRE